LTTETPIAEDANIATIVAVMSEIKESISDD